MHPEVVKEKHARTEGVGKGWEWHSGGGVLILIWMQTPNWPAPHSSVYILFSFKVILV